MQQDQSSNAIALDLDNADLIGFATEFPRKDFADTMDAASPGASGADVGKLVSIFKTAAEDQAGSYQALNERIDRLEQKEDFQSLRETVRDLYDVFSGFVGEMDRRLSQAENRIAAVAQTVEVLEENVASAEARISQAENGIVELRGSDSKAFAAVEGLAENLEVIKDRLFGDLNSTQLRVGQAENAIAQLKGSDAKAFAALDALSEDLDVVKDKSSRVLDSAEARVDQVERSIAGIKGIDSKAFAALDALSQNLASLGDRFSREQRESVQLGDRVRLAEHQIANLADCEVRVGALSKRVSELKEMERVLRELQGQGDQASADICTLGEDIRLLQGSVGSANTEYRQLKDRIEQAEGGIAASLEQSQSLARLHARLAETYALKTG